MRERTLHPAFALLSSVLSVGAGLWLQGGIGHLARLHGLWPGPLRRPCTKPTPASRYYTLYAWKTKWAIKGAGTNFGIVISITFKAYTTPTYRILFETGPSSEAITSRRGPGLAILINSSPANFPGTFLQTRTYTGITISYILA